LEEVSKVNSGRDYKHLNQGEIPVYGTGGYMLSVDESLSDEDAVGIGRKGTIDKPQLLKAPFWTVDTLFYMTPKPNNELTFLFTLSQGIEWAKLDESTGVPSLSKVNIENVAKYIPDLHEQAAIGSFFRNLDDIITASQRKVEGLKRLKAAYLQQMFPPACPAGKQAGERVPRVRFVGYKGDWSETKLGEIADIVRGASPRPIQDPKWFDENSDVGWLRISDVTEQGGRIRHLEQKISKAGQSKTRVLTQPHLLLSIAATVGKPVINYVKAGVHDGFLIFLNPQFEQEFMFQWLEMFRLNWQQYGQPGSQVNLNSDLVKNQETRIPSRKEQFAIGNFFHNFDTQIASQSEKVEKLKQIKSAYLQKMII